MADTKELKRGTPVRGTTQMGRKIKGTVKTITHRRNGAFVLVATPDGELVNSRPSLLQVAR